MTGLYGLKVDLQELNKVTLGQTKLSTIYLLMECLFCGAEKMDINFFAFGPRQMVMLSLSI